jgi:hypothetical protein
MKKLPVIVVLALLLSQFLTPLASALTIDSVEVHIQDNGCATVDFHYSINWLEKILIIGYGLIGEDMSERELIESKFSKWLGKEVAVTNLNTKSGDVTLGISDFIDKREHTTTQYK